PRECGVASQELEHLTAGPALAPQDPGLTARCYIYLMANFSSLRLRLEPASQEQAYREAVLPRNARALRAILLVAVVFQLANTPNDRAVVSEQADFLLVMGARLVGAAVSLLALTLVREDMSPRR